VVAAAGVSAGVTSAASEGMSTSAEGVRASAEAVAATAKRVAATSKAGLAMATAEWMESAGGAGITE